MVALYGGILAFSILISAALTWFIRNLANRYRWAAGSISSHHIHARQIPRFGGLAVFLSFFLVLAGYMLASPWLGARGGVPRIQGDVLKLLVPAAFLFAIGLVDDLRTLSARAKLLGQIIGGVLLYAGGLHLFDISLQDFHIWGAVLSFAATVFFVVLMCNAMNLIDGLDGLAAGVGLFSMVSILVFAWVGGAAPIAVTTIILGGAVAGFLVFNFCPASIFLGDSGSLFLGFMLSGLVIALSRRQENTLNAVMLPVFCFALPLADTSISVLRRFLGRRPLFQADQGHVHHMLLNLGLSHRSAVWVLYGMAAICTVLSLVLLSPSHLLLASAGALLLLLVLFCVRKLGYQEFAEISRIWQRISAYRAATANGAALNGHRDPVTYSDQRPARVPVRSEVDLEMEIEEGGFTSASMLPEVPAEEAAG